MVSSKPVDEIDEEHAQTNADKITASNGHHFGDKLSWEDLTTPKGASKQYSLSYDETNFPEEPVHEDPVYDPNDKPSRTKRQFTDDIVLSKQFFADIFKGSRISRDTNGVPTIALHDLISSVEHTLIHSAQNLAASNVTSNVTTTITETSNGNVTNTQHTSIVLPITIPTPAPKSTTESVETTTVTEDDFVRDSRSSGDEVSEHEEIDSESIKPIPKSNLGLLFPISLMASANVYHVNVTDNEDVTEEAPVTEEVPQGDQSNITIIQTINSTQLIPTDSDVVHVHQQHITLFSANAGFFPNIHALKVEDLPALAQKVETSSLQPDHEDCSGEENSDESSSSEEKASSNSSSEESDKPQIISCRRKISIATPKTVNPVEETTAIVTAKKTKTDELKEKIAEVEADPVILTQGI